MSHTPLPSGSSTLSFQNDLVGVSHAGGTCEVVLKAVAAPCGQPGVNANQLEHARRCLLPSGQVPHDAGRG